MTLQNLKVLLVVYGAALFSTNVHTTNSFTVLCCSSGHLFMAIAVALSIVGIVLFIIPVVMYR